MCILIQSCMCYVYMYLCGNFRHFFAIAKRLQVSESLIVTVDAKSNIMHTKSFLL